MPAAAIDIKRDRDRFVGFAFSAADLLLEVDGKLAIRFASGAMQKLTGVNVDQAEGLSLLDLVQQAEGPLVAQALESIAEGGRLDPLFVQLRAERAHEERQAMLGACRLPGGDELYRVTLTLPPAIALSEIVAGRRDAATGAFTAQTFSELASRAAREGEVLTFLQLEGLDELRGRAKSDAINKLMKQAMTFLRANSLEGDSVGRIGDDKFGLLQSPDQETEDLAAPLEQMARALDPTGEGLSVREGSIDLTSGTMSDRDVTKTITYLLRSFAEAPAPILSLGSLDDCFKLFLDETLTKVTEIKKAVAGRAFHLLFQPIVELNSREIHHYEGLCRFAGGKPPSEVFSFAEDIGLVEELDLAVCSSAVDSLQQRFAAGGSLELAVNLSGRSIESDIFVGQLHAICQSLGMTRRKLLFEITETSRVHDLERARQVLIGLREAGHPLCLDDFGKGNASFEYIQLLPFDFLKLDGELVLQAAQDKRAAAIVKAAASLSRDLGIRCIAEAIERQDQIEWLRSIGVGFGQGYLFGKPAREIAMTVGNERLMATAS